MSNGEISNQLEDFLWTSGPKSEMTRSTTLIVQAGNYCVPLTRTSRSNAVEPSRRKVWLSKQVYACGFTGRFAWKGPTGSVGEGLTSSGAK